MRSKFRFNREVIPQSFVKSLSLGWYRMIAEIGVKELLYPKQFSGKRCSSWAKMYREIQRQASDCGAFRAKNVLRRPSGPASSSIL
jgi:NAD dependent epimerase/dehydratase family enzyme